MCLSRFWCKSKGFSLVELLVVISVIAILAGLLFPVLLRSKRHALQVQCSSNMRQLGRAFDLYLSDWSSVYPSPGGLRGDHNYWSQTGNGGLVPYIGENGGADTVWCCPELGYWNGYYPARTYCMNSYLRDPPDIDYPSCIHLKRGCPQGAVEEPRSTILLFEGIPVTVDVADAYYDYIYRCGNWECVRGWYTARLPKLHTMDSWKPWHGNRNNFLYCDGHIKSMEPYNYSANPRIRVRYDWWVQKGVQYEKWKRLAGGW